MSEPFPRPDLCQYAGKTLHILVDRPIGYDHHGLIYPINYGYLPGVLAGDGEEQDAYILGVSQPLKEFVGVAIGAALRKDDCEDKLIVAPADMSFTLEEVRAAIHYQDQFFDSEVILF